MTNKHNAAFLSKDSFFNTLVSELPQELVSGLKENRLLNPGTLRSYPRTPYSELGLASILVAIEHEVMVSSGAIVDIARDAQSVLRLLPVLSLTLCLYSRPLLTHEPLTQWFPHARRWWKIGRNCQSVYRVVQKEQRDSRRTSLRILRNCLSVSMIQEKLRFPNFLVFRRIWRVRRTLAPKNPSCVLIKSLDGASSSCEASPIIVVDANQVVPQILMHAPPDIVALCHTLVVDGGHSPGYEKEFFTLGPVLEPAAQRLDSRVREISNIEASCLLKQYTHRRKNAPKMPRHQRISFSSQQKFPRGSKVLDQNAACAPARRLGKTRKKKSELVG